MITHQHTATADSKENERYIRSDSFTHISPTQREKWDKRVKQTDEIPSAV